ncbi:hypothetical protein HNQ60_005357 [Povalibacter uvarum]|uniref:Uncharacterized protein n=1 Tax=Povalibacter uvarum TaxID=732238 RepID=A0A841HXC1_9GAMM|nr:hypothetical protein [Povalibacter uvarum]
MAVKVRGVGTVPETVVVAVATNTMPNNALQATCETHAPERRR